jgi:hypothetical protein
VNVLKEKYSIMDKAGMKKYLKKCYNDDFFDDETIKDDKIIKDNEIIKDDKQYQKVKAFYDSLKNCNKAMVYRDAKHWYVQID